MRYTSCDHNCVIDPGDSAELAAGIFPLATITVVYPCLLSLSPEKEGQVVTLYNKNTHRDICSFEYNSPSCPKDERHVEHTMLVKDLRLLADVVTETEACDITTSLFKVKIAHEAKRRELHELDPSLHSDFETMAMELITERKRRDKEAIRQFISQVEADFDDFETNLNEQAMILSHVALQTSRSSSNSTQHNVTTKKDRQSSSNSDRSTISSSSASERGKKKGVTPKRKPRRAATLPVSNPTPVVPIRKSSMMEKPRKDRSTTPTSQKKVMFDEHDPVKIDSPHPLPSDTEDETIEPDPEEVFDMDEQIPVVPITSQQQGSLPTESVEISTGPERGANAFGRQEDFGLSASFKIRSLEKYRSPDGSDGPDLRTQDLKESDTSTSQFGTSLPRDIKMPPANLHTAPLSSVKDIPTLSSDLTDLADDSLADLGDSPPRGMSRRTMWKKAVASSLRMSGLLLPTLSQEEIDQTMPMTARQSILGT